MTDEAPDPQEDMVLISRAALDAFSKDAEARQKEADTNADTANAWRSVAKWGGGIFAVTMLVLALTYINNSIKAADDRKQNSADLRDAGKAIDRINEVLGSNPILITQDQIEGFAVTVDCNNRQALQEVLDQVATEQGEGASPIHVTDNCPPPTTEP